MTPPARSSLAVAVGLVLVAGALLSACVTRKETGEARERQAAAQPLQRDQTAPDEGRVVLDSGAAARAGIVTLAMQRATRGRELKLTGELIPDSGRMVTIRAPVAGRLVASDSTPWPLYGEQMSEGRVLGQVSDAKPLIAPKAGTVTRVSALPGEIVQAGEPLLEITDFTQPLARVVWRAEAPPSPPTALSIAPLGATSSRVRARLVGPAPQADPLTRSPVYLYRAEGAWLGARPGNPIEARFPDPRVANQGLIIPTDAVIQWEGLAWVYLVREPGRYVREAIDTDYPVEGGYLVRSGLAPGDFVVVRGAQQLLSEEFRARQGAGEESEEH